jgi:hypothetical protein
MNTPSHHRVHHATNLRYLDKNFAETFIIWDRLFGTFAAEMADDPPRFGITKNIATHNPIRIAAHEWVSLARDMAGAGSLRDGLRYLLKPPGWSAVDVPKAAEMIAIRSLSTLP